MRKLLRIGVICAVIFLALVAGVATFLYLNQQRFISLVLAAVNQRSGIKIAPRSSHIDFTPNLVVVLEHPRISAPNRPSVEMDRLEIGLSYHAILSNHGLPLRYVEFESPTVTAPVEVSAAHRSFPHPDARAVEAALSDLRQFDAITSHIDIINLRLRDSAGTPILQYGQITLVQRVLAQRLRFIGECIYPQFNGMRFAGTFRIDPTGSVLHQDAAAGTLWYWGMPLSRVSIGNVEGSGESHGVLSLSIGRDGELRGDAGVAVDSLVASSRDLAAPLHLGNYRAQAHFTTSASQFMVSRATISHGQQKLIEGEARIANPYTANPRLGIDLAVMHLTWQQVGDWMRNLKRIPPPLETWRKYLRAGDLDVSRISIDSPLSLLKKESAQQILRRISLAATFRQVSFALPDKTKIPDVSRLSFQLSFEKGVLAVLQGSAQVGNSQIANISAQLDFSRSFQNVPYKVALKANADSGELQPAFMKACNDYGVDCSGRLKAFRGGVGIDLTASGTFKPRTPTPPVRYEVRIEPHNLTAEVRGAPGPIAIKSGSLTITPRSMRVQRLGALATGGTAYLNGDLRFGPNGMQTHGMAIDMHQMPIEQWLPLAVDPASLDASGPVGGEMVISSGPNHGIVVNGKLTLQKGKVQFGFLRAPIMVQVATVTLHDRSLVLSIPDGRLEESPITWKISVPDIHNPSISLEVDAAKLNVEVMKFVRLPWTAATAPIIMPYPISGHVIARQANLESFAMKDGATDFTYNHGNWHIYNFRAKSFDGTLNLEIAGRKGDNWINIKGTIADMSVATLFLMKSSLKGSPLTGHLDVLANLWADSNGDFFETMAGTATVNIRNGNLHKFKLLSRILGLIDVRTWLSAKLPDPRVSGVPFRSITSNFTATHGLFYTNNLYLDGPVMDVIAYGNVNFANSTLRMKIGAIPFGTVSWLLSNVPLIGKNIYGGTRSIIAAYFNVTGPLADPRVTPAPITSMTELLKKTIGLPINLIRPNTIR